MKKTKIVIEFDGTYMSIKMSGRGKDMLYCLMEALAHQLLQDEKDPAGRKGMLASLAAALYARMGKIEQGEGGSMMSIDLDELRRQMEEEDDE